jgi:hypothetical protein
MIERAARRSKDEASVDEGAAEPDAARPREEGDARRGEEAPRGEGHEERRQEARPQQEDLAALTLRTTDARSPRSRRLC